MIPTCALKAAVTTWGREGFGSTHLPPLP